MQYLAVFRGGYFGDRVHTWLSDDILRWWRRGLSGLLARDWLRGVCLCDEEGNVPVPRPTLIWH